MLFTKLHKECFYIPTLLQLPVFVMLADQFTACNQAPLATIPPSLLALDLPQKATAEDRLNGREFVKKKEKREMEKKMAVTQCCVDVAADLDSV